MMIDLYYLIFLLFQESLARELQLPKLQLDLHRKLIHSKS